MKTRLFATGGNGQTRPPGGDSDDQQLKPVDTPDDAPVDDSGTFAPKTPAAPK